MKINTDLIWDYKVGKEQMETESFREWYIARVLMRGGAADIRAVGVDTIRGYLPRLTLPKDIREFWEWYFSAEEGCKT